jgi:tetratricopeptide (TPR) repeat protein
MKKNNIYIILSIFALTFFMAPSCTDMLVEEPIGTLAPESFFQSESDVEAAVMGIYTVFSWESIYGRYLPMTVNLLDDVCDIANLGTVASRVQKNNFVHDANDGDINGAWEGLYKAIGAANSAINGAETITPTNETLLNELKAEAMLGRAHCYYQLVRLFGEVPYVGEFVDDPESVSDMSKTSVDEIYQNIIADCEFAEQNLPDKYTNDIRCRPSKGTAKTMLASVYLTLGEYAKAAEYAEEVINTASTYGYALVPDFSELWVADNGDMEEHIWTVDFLTGSWITREYWAPWTAPGEMNGYNVICASPGLFDKYDAGDHRIELTFLQEVVSDGDTIPYTEWAYPRLFMAKYCLYPGELAKTNGERSGRNFPIYRFSEVYLIAAEALAEANDGPTAKAYEYINKVRERARYGGTEPADLLTGMSKDEFIDEVLDERLREFPLEYKRWFDIKRRQMGDEVFKGEDSLEPHDTFDASKHYLMPLPQDELDKNPNLLPQNPGY